MAKIYIDAGHGGSSIGAVYKGRKEQDDTLRLALAAGKLVEAQGVTVKYSRTTDVNPDLTGRCNEANAWGADYFISIHRNAYQPNQAQGVEAYVYSKCNVGGGTYNKAKVIVDDVCAATEFKNRGVKLGAPSYTDFAVNSVTEMSSCLLECGFIDSDADNKIFDEKFNAMALALAKGLCAAVGVTYKEAPDANKPADDKMYTLTISPLSRYNVERLTKLLAEHKFYGKVTEVQ